MDAGTSSPVGARACTNGLILSVLLDEANQVRGQMDSQPLGGSRPTTKWVPQEYVQHGCLLTVASDALPGDYVIEIGMSDAGMPDSLRLPMVASAGHVLDNRIA